MKKRAGHGGAHPNEDVGGQAGQRAKGLGAVRSVDAQHAPEVGARLEPLLRGMGRARAGQCCKLAESMCGGRHRALDVRRCADRGRKHAEGSTACDVPVNSRQTAPTLPASVRERVHSMPARDHAHLQQRARHVLRVAGLPALPALARRACRAAVLAAVLAGRGAVRVARPAAAAALLLLLQVPRGCGLWRAAAPPSPASAGQAWRGRRGRREGRGHRAAREEARGGRRATDIVATRRGECPRAAAGAPTPAAAMPPAAGGRRWGAIGCHALLLLPLRMRGRWGRRGLAALDGLLVVHARLVFVAPIWPLPLAACIRTARGC